VLAISLPLTFAFLVGFSWILEIFFPPQQGGDIARYFWLGLLAAIVFILAMAAFAYYLRKPLSRLLLLAGYFVVLIAQIVCIFYTQSRGPLLGLLAGMFVYFALLGLIKRQVWLPWLMTGVAVAVGVFLIMFNTVESPLMETLREVPYVGRLGQVLQTEEGTGKVRVLIWEGVTNMMSWHDPLETPGKEGGPDPLNALRPVLGYGPESMYVAYNRFYPPDLAHYEKRNASPDRSHNETFDALVITGVVGFLAYMLVFTSVFYYALKWLGLLGERWQRIAFLVLWIGGGIAGALGAWAWRGAVYIGVGIPGGVMLGLAIYVFVVLLDATFRSKDKAPLAGRNALWVLALFAAVVAHFVEIHFGIAIAATRTYFWVYVAMLVVIGTRLATQPAEAELTKARAVVSTEKKPEPRRRRRRSAAPSPIARPNADWGEDWRGSILVWSLLAVLVLGTMLFDFTTIQPGDPGLLATIWRSLTMSQGEPSAVMLVLLLGTWAMFGMVGLSDLATRQESTGREPRDWLAAIGIFALITFGGLLFFALLHAMRLKPVTIASRDAPNPLADTITFYYLFAFLIVVALALVLTFLFRRSTIPWRRTGELADIAVPALAVILPVLAAIVIFASNTSIVRADVIYKQGLSSEKAKQWDGAIYFYDKAIQIAENQDFYYLFLGRALMEKAKATKGQDREELLYQSEQSLLRAREIAPLNTDHSANLARLYRTWGELSKGDRRTDLLNQALDYYADATSLSPANAQLFNEWGQTYYALGEDDRALEMYEKSLSLDDAYLRTYLLLGEYHMNRGDYDEAVEAYERALKLRARSVEALSGLGFVYTQLGDSDAALAAYERAAQLKPKNFNNRKNLAVLYQQLGHTEDAIREATIALDLAPESQRQAMEAFLAQLSGTGSAPAPEDAAAVQELSALGREQMDAKDWESAASTYERVLDLDPFDLPAHSALAYVYAKQGLLDEAIAENLAVLSLLPDDYNSHKNLSLLYQQTGQISEAIAEAETALGLAPESEAEAVQAYLDQLRQLEAPASPTAEPGQRAGDLAPDKRNGMYSSPPPMTIDPGKSYQATIVTDKGNIVLELHADRVPNTVNSFVFLAREGFYDNTTFHRVLPDFMAQAGDPAGTGGGGPGYDFADEFDPELGHDGPGVLSMANRGPNTNGSQFFITLEATPWLDDKHAVFGRVIEGMDVLNSLTPRDPQQNPDYPGDTILTIVIQEQ
jgi:cyclophilin family peptidyl-prolyl cis-trans isomerase/tetratricopeptide (TPR) repeat protein